MEPRTCAVCLTPGALEQTERFENTDLTVQCGRCGRYRTTEEAQEGLSDKAVTTVQRANLSGFLAETPGFRFHSKMLPRLLAMRVPSVSEKGDRLLAFLAEQHPTPGERFRIQCDDFTVLVQARAWNLVEVEYLAIEFMADVAGYLALPSGRHLSSNGVSAKIAPRGWMRLAELREKPTTSSLGFIAMWFKPSMEPVRDNALIPGVQGAGYEPKVINLHEHANRIDDEIVALIRRSRFVVADFTGNRGGVYFEAGFAHGLGLPVIWTCKRVTLEKGKLHFDVSHFNFLSWDEGDEACADFRGRLQNRIEAVVGRGPLTS